jgi:hypothetical protein
MAKNEFAVTKGNRRTPQFVVRHSCSAIALCAALLAVAACQPNTELQDLRRENMRLAEQLDDSRNRTASLETSVEKLNEQLRVARGLSREDLRKIFYPERLQIERLTGGYDRDEQPGDDGVVVYLKPIDRDGDAIKVVGDIRIELYDLANPSGQKLIGEYFFPADEVSQHWYGSLLTYHYTLRCPWRQGPPQHRELTIRVTFVDFLTQRVITAQTTCEVNLPGTATNAP